MHSLQMHPATGERCVRFVGDRIRFVLRASSGSIREAGRAYLRTNLGRARRVRNEIIQSYTNKLPSAGASWRDVAMHEGSDHWWIELPLVAVGFFQAKAYLVDTRGRQFWPEGPNVLISVQPDQYRTGNTIYCAFVRMFGETRTAATTVNEPLEAQLAQLDKQGYTVIPPSGKLRDLTRQLPHIVETLGCRILHLLPIHPVPTTYARFGRFGSPYAVQDLMAVDPALVEFDRRTTGIDQFRELTYAAHLRHLRVFLDLVTNHTGWGSTLQENHPDWFLRAPDGRFASPGAWGVTWEDLVELDHRNPASWEHLAEVFLTWCRRGVDGFRCDAGYKVPVAAWRYITACVRQEYPETIFLLEGLGGSWEATEALLGDGGLQWAYSELFQNYSGSEVASYLDYAHRQSERAGLYVHYSETHDNDRLARKGRAWSLLRNRLCGLTSVSGGYGFTCGVEWLATEKIDVHSSRGLRWGASDNLNAELARLNRLLAEHPCFFDHARLRRLSPNASPVYALHRQSEEGLDQVLVLVNTDTQRPGDFALPKAVYAELGEPKTELVAEAPPKVRISEQGVVSFTLLPGACHCLAATDKPKGLAGDAYRRARACAAFALQALSQVLPVEEIGAFSWRKLAERVERDPERFLAVLRRLDPAQTRTDLVAALDSALAALGFPQVVVWSTRDVRRILMVPPEHWLLVRDEFPFRATLSVAEEEFPTHAHSIQVRDGFVAFFSPRNQRGNGTLGLERYAPTQTHLTGSIRFLGEQPDLSGLPLVDHAPLVQARGHPLILLTNGRGGMARICSDLGRIKSKYDCLLGANLHPSVPVDRHIFVKRVRAWIVADRFISPLDQFNLVFCDPGPPARWSFVPNAGDGRTVDVQLEIDLLEDRNTAVLRFSRPQVPSPSATDLPDSCEVRLTVRLDLEDRNFHWETRRNSSAEHHFSTHCQPLAGQTGFAFTPAADRKLRVFADAGEYHPEPEWSENIPHPVEESRGQVPSGDAYSPGWFDLPLPRGACVTLTVCADPVDPEAERVREFVSLRKAANEARLELGGFPETDAFGRRLVLAAHQFLVQRGTGKTVIAGYPWFLDWGRDTFICARGFLAAGLIEAVRQILTTFGRFEDHGTLPNSIFGEDASNRDTSDAPLWFALACEEAAALDPGPIYDAPVNEQGRPLRAVLKSIAQGYQDGTPNGIRMDPDSALVWSPAHFTWMDTNYPAGTPREGYPVEIQVLWIRLLQQLGRIDEENARHWRELAERAQSSLLRLFWLEDRGYLADCLLAGRGQNAASATPDTALRSNGLFAVSLGLLTGEPARRCVQAALYYLVVPGGLRSLAPLPVTPPLPIHGPDGRLLNNPHEPYWGRYAGDEDTQRKPAYHNGTAWTWTFPSFCEALARAWEKQPAAVAAARAYLASFDRLLCEGCLGQIPEILDGDAPHTQRGCDAQAWGVTEALRVWKWLSTASN